ncbi:MAG: DUF4440 domain-containing protein [Blastocatellia bacterium]
MKNIVLLSVAMLLVAFSTSFGAHAQESKREDVKVKTKGGKLILRDKSKPVRKALEDWYAQNSAAFQQKDVAAVMALRADDFHTVLPDGTTNTRADMQAYTVRLLGMIEEFLTLDFAIGTIDVQGDLASADVTQKTVRRQRLPDGQIHQVDARAVQRETWKKTADGWKLYRVDNIRDQGIWVDGNLFRRPQ